MGARAIRWLRSRNLPGSAPTGIQVRPLLVSKKPGVVRWGIRVPCRIRSLPTQ